MKKLFLLLPALALASAAGAQAPTKLAALEQRAKTITITRDDWGIPHIYGKTDADAVFGLVYAQAEDDFNRVETNFINSMGRLAEAEGEKRDLARPAHEAVHQSRFDEGEVCGESGVAEEAHGRVGGRTQLLSRTSIPQVKPRVIKQFEPWMALTFSEGSIGGDIEKVNLGAARRRSTAATPTRRPIRLHDADAYTEPTRFERHRRSRRRTRANHHALLLINPHTSFFFRAEVQMTSDEGLNAYGAVTWGQFFIYQGFNDESRVDAHDERRRRHRTSTSRQSCRRATSTSTNTAAKSGRSIAQKIAVPYKTRRGHGEEGVHRLLHAARPGHPQGRRQVGRDSASCRSR